jgi:hypothetical protein
MPDDQSWQKQLAMQWKRAAPFLAEQRRRDIRRENPAQAIDALDSIFRHAIKTRLPSRTSGFVKMYEILNRSRNR